MHIRKLMDIQRMFSDTTDCKKIHMEDKTALFLPGPQMAL